MTTTPAALAWINLFDSATVSCSTSATNTPASNLQVAHVQKKWRGATVVTDSILATYTTNQLADTFALMGLGADISIAAMTIRLRLSSSDATGAAGDRYDTGVLSGEVDANYAMHVHLASAVKTGWKYARWDISLASAAYVECGRATITNRTQVTYNFTTGARRGWQDRSKITESADFQQYVDRRSKYREWDVTFPLVDLTQRDAVFEAMAMANGRQTDVLFVSDPSSANLGRDSVWGLMDEVPQILFPHTNDIFSTSVKIRERR